MVLKKTGFLLLFFTLAFAAYADKGEANRILVHTLNYLGQDYKNAVKDGKVISEDEYEEMGEFCESAVKYFHEFSSEWSDSDSVAIGKLIADIDSLVEHKGSPAEVSKKAAEAKMKIVAITGLRTYPSHYPDIEAGRKLYVINCAKCHGDNGFGDGPEGKGLDPKPRNFHDNNRLDYISPSHAFNTIRLGVEGTGMRAHVGLEDEEVWNLAFYVLSLRYDKAESVDKEALKQVPLEKIATESDHELQQEFKLNKEQLAAIRLNHPHQSNDRFLKMALDYLDKANASYNNARSEEALQFASLAYLQGIEPIELQLKATEPELSDKLEKQMQHIRKMISENRPMADLADSIAAAKQTLSEVSQVLEKKEYSFWLALFMSVSILLREGLEAFLVIMVILSVLKAANMQLAARWVHAGWIVAIIAGVALWVISTYLMPDGFGEMELVEAIISFVAVAMLLYIGFWMHSKSEVGKWKDYVSNLVSNAVNSGSLMGLFTLSFFVVFREVFESVVFLSSLNIESGGKQTHAILFGVAIAFLCVFALAFIVLRFSAKLPIPQLFKISSLVMGLLAIVLTGKGIHSLQEVGRLSIHGVPMVRVELLGIFPTLETCVGQLITLVILVVIWNVTGKPAKKPAA